MSKHGAFITNKALAWWGGGAVLLAGTVVTGVLVAQSSAAPAGGTVAGTTSSAGNGQGGGNNGNGVGNGPGGAQPPPKALTVQHSMLGTVRLGAPATMRVTVTNPNNQAVDLKTVTANVTNVDSAAGTTPACTPSNFSISSYNGTRRIAKNGSTSVDLLVSMVENGANQDRCKGATYRFSFTATANQA